MSGSRSRNKGARIEREIVRALHGKGFAGARIRLSAVGSPGMSVSAYAVRLLRRGGGQGGRIPRIVLLARWS
jgi:Holliday junction resolvase